MKRRKTGAAINQIVIVFYFQIELDSVSRINNPRQAGRLCLKLKLESRIHKTAFTSWLHAA